MTTKLGVAGRAAGLAAAALAATACITVGMGGSKQDLPPDRFHVLESPPPAAGHAAGPAAGPAQGVVAVRPFRASDRFGKHVLRRDGAGRVTPLEQDLWADEPSRAVTDAVLASLAASPAFRAAVDASSGARADVFLDGQVLEFCVETPAAGRSRAVVRLRLTWTAAKTGEVTSTQVREAAEDLPGPGTDGLGTAMARAVARAVGGGD